MAIAFERFSNVFPREPATHKPVDVRLLLQFIDDLQVNVPQELVEFWEIQGSGYFGARDLYFFGDGRESQPRDSFQVWNAKDFWVDVYPRPADGGPVFFAETCFGDQLGFRWEKGACIYTLFSVDTFDAFVVAASGRELFEQVLVDRSALVDPDRLKAVERSLGPLTPGMHYAPLVSPMLGGDGSADNFAFETPNVHFRTAIETYKAIQRAKRSASV